MRDISTLNARIDELTENLKALNRKLDEQSAGFVKQGLFNLLHLLELTLATEQETLKEYTKQFLSIAVNHSKNPAVTGSDKEISDQKSVCEVMQNHQDNWHGMIALMARLEVNNGTYQLRVDYRNLVNPSMWMYSVEAYMHSRSQVTDQKYFEESGRVEHFKRMITEGEHVRDFITGLQGDEEFFAHLINEYERATIEYLSGDPKNPVAVQRIDYYWQLLFSAIQTAFSYSYDTDLYFRSLLDPTVNWAFRLPRGTELRSLVANVIPAEVKTVSSEIRQNLDAQINVIRYALTEKIKAVKAKQEVEPYLPVEYMLQRLYAFGRYHHPEDKAFEKPGLQEPKIQSAAARVEQKGWYVPGPEDLRMEVKKDVLPLRFVVQPDRASIELCSVPAAEFQQTILQTRRLPADMPGPPNTLQTVFNLEDGLHVLTDQDKLFLLDEKREAVWTEIKLPPLNHDRRIFRVINGSLFIFSCNKTQEKQDNRTPFRTNVYQVFRLKDATEIKDDEHFVLETFSHETVTAQVHYQKPQDFVYDAEGRVFIGRLLYNEAKHYRQRWDYVISEIQVNKACGQKIVAAKFVCNLTSIRPDQRPFLMHDRGVWSFSYEHRAVENANWIQCRAFSASYPEFKD